MKNLHSNVSLPTQNYSKVSRGVLIERAHYYTILVEGVRTIQEGVLIEEGALTEVNVCLIFFQTKFCYDPTPNITNPYEQIKYIIGNNSVSPAEDYFNGNVLKLNKDETGARFTWEDYGSLQGHLVGCLAGSWVIICLTLIKGIQSYGKIAYVITLSPYFVLTILLSN